MSSGNGWLALATNGSIQDQDRYMYGKEKNNRLHLQLNKMICILEEADDDKIAEQAK